MSTLKRTITNTLKAYSRGSAGLVALIPTMLRHIEECGDHSSTVCRVLNGIEKKDAQRMRAIIVACIGDKCLKMTWDKNTGKWSTAFPKEGKVCFYTTQALDSLDSLVEEGVRLYSPKIDEALFDPKEPASFDIDKRADALVQKAFKEGFASDALMEAIFKAVEKRKKDEPAVTVENVEVIQPAGVEHSAAA